MTATRYIVSTNGVDLSTTFTSKAKALETARAYVWGAERMERDAQEHVHVITVRTATTGKTVFDETVTVPAKPVAPQTAVQAPCEGRPVTDPKTLDTAELNTDGTTTCGWCERTADRKIQIACQSHPEFACAGHFREYFPHLSNPQMISALCPTVSYGCEHTMAMNDKGYGVACVEFADAHGIQWMYA